MLCHWKMWACYATQLSAVEQAKLLNCQWYNLITSRTSFGSSLCQTRRKEKQNCQAKNKTKRRRNDGGIWKRFYNHPKIVFLKQYTHASLPPFRVAWLNEWMNEWWWWWWWLLQLNRWVLLKRLEKPQTHPHAHVQTLGNVMFGLSTTPSPVCTLKMHPSLRPLRRCRRAAAEINVWCFHTRLQQIDHGWEKIYGCEHEKRNEAK